MKTLIVLGALISSAFGLNIDCIFQDTALAAGFGAAYSCNVFSFTLTGSNSLLHVHGFHQAGRNHSHVRQIRFGGNVLCHNLNFIPLRVTNAFPNLIGMFLGPGCSIHNLTGEELSNYRNLEFFSVANNLIETVPSKLFEFNANLRYVDFGDNRIRQVGWNLLPHLDNLVTLYFNGNVCINRYATDSRAGVLDLIERVRINCADPDEPTGPTTIATTTEFDPNCPGGNTNQRICYLEDAIQRQQAEFEEYKRVMEQEMRDVREQLLYLTSRPCSC
jgi:Leucine rich repeat